MNLENPMVSGMGRYWDREERAYKLNAEAYESLRSEMVAALTNDPTKSVQTPAWGSMGQMNAAYKVVEDAFDGKNGEALLIELLRIVSGASRGDDMQIRADAWIAAVANEHAEYHHDILAQNLGDDE